MRDIPQKGEFYRDVRGNVFEIMAAAENAQTGDQMVVYRDFFDEEKVYVRQLENFLAPVNRIKYPNCDQEFQFERTNRPKVIRVDPALMQFLDADSYAQKLRIFVSVEHRLTDDMINTMAVSLDTEVPEGDLEERAESLKRFLSMQARFEVDR